MDTFAINIWTGLLCVMVWMKGLLTSHFFPWQKELETKPTIFMIKVKSLPDRLATTLFPSPGNQFT